MALRRYLGLISGTSMDGVDAVLARFDGPRFLAVEASAHLDYPDELRRRLLSVARDHALLAARDWCVLDSAIARHFAQCAKSLLDGSGIAPSEIAAIGSHGQTLFHDAAGDARLTLQLGDPNLIAAMTGVSVVADFRRLDLALGGQGAPLVPAFHHALFASADEPRCVLNLGGIANITLLPDAEAGHVSGFDTGPGNGLLDEWVALHLGQAYDDAGRYAASGQVNQPLLDALLGDPYFQLSPPKSTGRGDLHLDWVRSRYPRIEDAGFIAPQDVQATFAELTARTVADAIRTHGPATRRLLVCGGGVHNRDLLVRLQTLLPAMRIEPTSARGLDPQWVEASAFAWLAARNLEGLPGNLPRVTGASRPAILGGLYKT